MLVIELYDYHIVFSYLLIDIVAHLQRRFREQDAVVGYDADLLSVHARETGHDGGAIVLLELVELAGVDQTSDDLAQIIRQQ